MERLRLWMRMHDLSNRAYADRAYIEHAVAERCGRLTPERIQTICRTSWLERVDLP